MRAAQGNLRLFPAGTPVPLVSALNYTAAVTRANNATVPLNEFAEFSVLARPTGEVDFVLDVNGYFTN
jgi:hypothetical protein